MPATREGLRCGGADTQVAVGAFLEVLLAISGIATAVVLFPILKRQSEAISLGYVVCLGRSSVLAFGNGLLLGYLMYRSGMYRSGLVPRGMALLGLIGGPLAFAGGTGVLLGLFEQPSA